MSDDLYSSLTRRVEEAFERYDSYFPILHYAVYVPLQGLLDAAAGSISCKSGCSFCCSRLVVTSRVEGLALADYIFGYSSLDPDRVSAAVSTHAGALRSFMDGLTEEKDRNEIWFTKNIPCPFLENALCTVYEARPLSCRTYHSLDDPGKCKEPLRTVGQEKMLTDAEALFQMVLYRVAAKVDERLAMTGLFSLIMDEIIKSDMLKK